MCVTALARQRALQRTHVCADWREVTAVGTDLHPTGSCVARWLVRAQLKQRVPFRFNASHEPGAYDAVHIDDGVSMVGQGQGEGRVWTAETDTEACFHDSCDFVLWHSGEAHTSGARALQGGGGV